MDTVRISMEYYYIRIGIINHVPFRSIILHETSTYKASRSGLARNQAHTSYNANSVVYFRHRQYNLHGVPNERLLQGPSNREGS